MPTDIRLQVLLRPAYRNADGVERVRRLLEGDGLTVTGSGAASISARASPETLRKVFGSELPISRGAKNESLGEISIPIPNHMAEHVESITVAPQHTFMDRRPD